MVDTVEGREVGSYQRHKCWGQSCDPAIPVAAITLPMRIVRIVLSPDAARIASALHALQMLQTPLRWRVAFE
jgi:hypothetical protein